MTELLQREVDDLVIRLKGLVEVRAIPGHAAPRRASAKPADLKRKKGEKG